MGTFLGYYGNRDKFNNKEEFVKNVKQLLTMGGMVDIEKVMAFDKKIYLLDELKENKDGEIYFNYNTFEEDAWETAYFNTKTGMFNTGKVGNEEFNLVCRAIYVLSEFYAKEFGIAEQDGRVFNAEEVIGWINYVLGTKFTNKRIANPWKIYALEPEYWSDSDTILELALDYMKDGVVDLCGFSTLAYYKRNENKVWNILRDGYEEELKKEDNNEKTENITLFTCIDKLTNIITFLKDNGVTFETLKELLYKNNDELKNVFTNDETLTPFAFFIMLMPKPMSLIILCDIYEKDFWKNYDEKLSSTECLLNNKVEEPDAVEPVSTVEFFRPSAIKWFIAKRYGKEAQSISNDDLGYFWNDDFEFSDEYMKWTKELKDKFEKIKEEMKKRKKNGSLFKQLIGILDDIEKEYYRVYAYKSMFYEFVDNEDDINYRAMVELMQQELEENRMDDINSDDDNVTRRDVLYGSRRLNMKRLCALLANKKLRNKVFGF